MDAKVKKICYIKQNVKGVSGMGYIRIPNCRGLRDLCLIHIHNKSLDRFFVKSYNFIGKVGGVCYDQNRG